MSKVFISYRRQDTLAITGRIYDKLSERFGPENVFMDFDNIPLGYDFREHLEHSLQDCDVLLVVMGPNWVGRLPGTEGTRVSDPADFVRLEVQTALKRGVPVIPVLVGDTPLPAADQLPPEIQPLLYRQAASVDMGRDFHVHMQRLMAGIERIGHHRRVEAEVPTRPPRPAGADPSQPAPAAAMTAARSTIQPPHFLHPQTTSLLVDLGGQRWRAIGMWTLVGAVAGVTSWTSFGPVLNALDPPQGEVVGWLLFLGEVVGWLLFLTPGIVFGAAVYLAGELSSSPPLRRKGKLLSFALLALAGVLGWYAAVMVFGRIVSISGFSVPLEPLASGAVGSSFLVVTVLGLWRLEVRRLIYAGLVIATGGVAGSLCALLQEPARASLYLFVPWQALVLAAISTASILTQSPHARGERAEIALREKRVLGKHERAVRG